MSMMGSPTPYESASSRLAHHVRPARRRATSPTPHGSASLRLVEQENDIPFLQVHRLLSSRPHCGWEVTNLFSQKNTVTDSLRVGLTAGTYGIAVACANRVFTDSHESASLRHDPARAPPVVAAGSPAPYESASSRPDAQPGVHRRRLVHRLPRVGLIAAASSPSARFTSSSSPTPHKSASLWRQARGGDRGLGL